LDGHLSEIHRSEPGSNIKSSLGGIRCLQLTSSPGLMDRQQENQRHSWLENIESIAKIISLIVIPVAVASLAPAIQSAISSNELNRRYVELAIQILSRKPVAENGPDADAAQALREWAVDLLNASSPVQLSKVGKQALSAGSISLALDYQKEYTATAYTDPRLNKSTILLCNQSRFPAKVAASNVYMLSKDRNVLARFSTVIRDACPIKNGEIGVRISNETAHHLSEGNAATESEFFILIHN